MSQKIRGKKTIEGRGMQKIRKQKGNLSPAERKNWTKMLFNNIILYINILFLLSIILALLSFA